MNNMENLCKNCGKNCVLTVEQYEEYRKHLKKLWKNCVLTVEQHE